MSTDQQPMLLDAGPVPLRVGPVFVAFEITGKPGHKGRHRSRIVFPADRKKPPFVHHYADPETEKYEALLAEVGALHMRGRAPSEQPLAILVHAFCRVPDSWSRREREQAIAGAIRPTSRPDSDNYLKVVQDALNGVCYRDDSQIVDARVIKRYDERPGMRIELREFLPLGDNADKG